MILYVCYNNDCIDFSDKVKTLCETSYPEIKVEIYNENHYQEKKKAYKIKGGYSARMTPFMLLLDDNKKYLKTFYSEDNSCNINNLKAFLENHESKSN